MRIVIIGGGISGLSLYLFLQKLFPASLPSHGSSLELVVYETHEARKRDSSSELSGVGDPSFASGIVGGALGIAPNGLKVLRHLDENLYAAIVEQGYPVSLYWIQNALGWNISRIPATDTGNPPLQTVLITRQALWNLLRDRVPDSALERKRVSRVICANDQRPRISFADGSPDGEADLVVGADGVRSIAKSAVLPADGASDKHNAVYEGLLGVGGFIPSSQLPPAEPPARITMTFGPQGFFGYGVCTSSVLAAPARNDTTTTKIPPAPGPHAFWWSTYSHTQLPNIENVDRDDIRAQLQSRHGSWANPVIRSIVAGAEIGAILPTWTTPDLPTWERNGVVLIGDAAHALQPSSGQGVSQALEDAQVLALLLRHCLGQSRGLGNDDNDDEASNQAERIPIASAKKNAIIQAAEAYCKLRKPRVKRIADRARAIGDMKRKKSFVGEWLTYFFIWLLGKWPWDSYTKYVVDHDVALEVESFITTDQKQ
ncbi:hypothetical protein MMC22_011956 [Lobaria immixta]|nr:hypothetical protein [Lobaria immixta]